MIRRSPPLLLILCFFALSSCRSDFGVAPSVEEGLDSFDANAKAGPRGRGDADGDGYDAPEDCLDSGSVWAEFEPTCSTAMPAVFLPADGAAAKDFAFTESDGVHHLIYTRSFGPWGPGSDSQTTFGYATSADFVAWTAQPPLDLRGESGDWNDRNIWAPHIHKRGAKYYMFYTGVTYEENRAYNLQRIGLFTSRDLVNWTPASTTCPDVSGQGCILDCSADWTSWGMPEAWTGNCRDPFILRFGGDFLMYLTTSLPDGRQVIAVAQSSDLKSWQLVSVIDATRGFVAESPSVIERDGIYHLFWSRNDGIRHATATDPFGPYGPSELVNTGFANELMPIRDGSETLFPYVSDVEVFFTRLTWEGPNFTAHNNASPLCLVPAAAIYPGAPDPVNGIDDDCDGLVDGIAARRLAASGALRPVVGRW